MKSSSIIFFLLIFLYSCGDNGSETPDVSTITVNTGIQRFDLDYFSLDSNALPEGMKQLATKYPGFIHVFTKNILGAGPLSDSNSMLPVANKLFYTTYYDVYKGTKESFADLAPVEKELNKAFRYVKYYYPEYKVPAFIAYLGPFDAPGVAITQDAIAIGLQLYAGADFPFYTSTMGQEIFPSYISRRFEKKYIPTNCIKAVIEDMYPDKSQGLPLLEQMVEKGKAWWLQDKFLPATADSIKTGYTGKQVEWVKENEGVIWNLVLQNDHLYSMEPGIIQMYIGDAPGIQGFPPAAPGNVGQWIGKQIVNAYAAKHPNIQPDSLMKLPVREIIDGAKYKPR